jgi:hypothetical protein
MPCAVCDRTSGRRERYHGFTMHPDCAPTAWRKAKDAHTRWEQSMARHRARQEKRR